MTGSNQPDLSAATKRLGRLPVLSRAGLGGALAIVTLSLHLLHLNASPGFSHFITARGDHLLEDERPFRWISFNIPNLHLVEDSLPFTETHPWRWPDALEIRDALESVRQQGGTRTNRLAGVP